jgi:hypothetical protein
MARRCERCGSELSTYSRASRKFCSPTCRSAAARERERPRAPVSSPEPPAGVPALAVLPERGELEAALERALSETRLVATVAAHANSRSTTSWRAAAWLLERRYAERWAVRPRVPVESVPVDADDPFREVDELAERRRRALERRKR